MAHTREKSKSRKGSGRFAGIPHLVMNHADYVELSANAIRLLLEMSRQYNGRNNGDLSAAWTLMRERGWKSETTLTRALHELLTKEFLLRTREGRFINPGKQCALYAITWQAIDECPGKQLDTATTTIPFRAFSAAVIKMPSPETGAIGSKKWSQEGGKHAK